MRVYDYLDYGGVVEGEQCKAESRLLYPQWFAVATPHHLWATFIMAVYVRVHYMCQSAQLVGILWGLN